MRMDVNGKLIFEVGDRVRPRYVKVYDAETKKHRRVPHEKAYGGMRADEKGKVVERGLEDVVHYVDEGSLQIQLASWIKIASEHPGKQSSLRTRMESFEWYDSTDDPEEEPAPARKRGGTGQPTVP